MALRSLLGGVAAWMGAIGLASTFVPTAQAVAAASEDSGVIEEIIVTSRRRAESAQDIPVSVTAFREADIERIAPQTIRDLDGLMPNVFIGMNTAGPSAGAIFIRGVGYADIEKTQSPAVGVAIDGVYQGTSTGQLIDAFDIAQIEVNRGPQGVLFGKNTTGGTIVVTRTRPTFDPSAKLSYETGDYSNHIAKARASFPLAEDKLAMKVGGTFKKRDGFYDNVTLGGNRGKIDYFAATAALLFTPTDNFEALFTVDRIEDSGEIPPQDPRYNGDNPFINESDIQESQKLSVDGYSLQMNLDLDWGKFISITGFSNNDDKVLQDFDGASITGGSTPLGRLHTLRDQVYDQFSQELRFEKSFGDNIDVTLGGYYFESDLDFEQNTETIIQIPNAAFPALDCPTLGVVAGLPPLSANPALGDTFCQFPPTFARQIANEKVESQALFGSVTWRLNEAFEIAGGVRWIDEEKKFRNAYFDTTAGVTPGASLQDDDSWDDIVFEGSINWQFTDSNSLFARFAQGFRSGGFAMRGTSTAVCSATVCDPNDAAVFGTTIDIIGPSVLGPDGLEVAAPPDGLPDFLVRTPTTFEPEEVWSVELGSKNEFMDGKLRVNLAAFYTEIEGAQFSTVVQTPTLLPSTNTIINNAGTQEIKGLEAEVTWLLGGGFTLIATGGLQETKSDDFEIDGARSNFGPGSTVLRAGTTVTQQGQDWALRVPEHNWSLTGVYEREMGPGMLTASLSYRGQDEFPIGANLGQPIYEDAYELMDASISYAWTTSGGKVIRLFAYGKNLTDEEYKEQILTLGSVNSGFQGWGPPRTWNIGIEADF